jgi:hypothetical protein
VYSAGRTRLVSYASEIAPDLVGHLLSPFRWKFRNALVHSNRHRPTIGERDLPSCSSLRHAFGSCRADQTTRLLSLRPASTHLLFAMTLSADANPELVRYQVLLRAAEDEILLLRCQEGGARGGVWGRREDRAVVRERVEGRTEEHGPLVYIMALTVSSLIILRAVLKIRLWLVRPTVWLDTCSSTRHPYPRQKSP